jgi:F0F1-type ATP synthase membrane subunit a
MMLLLVTGLRFLMTLSSNTIQKIKKPSVEYIDLNQSLIYKIVVQTIHMLHGNWEVLSLELLIWIFSLNDCCCLRKVKTAKKDSCKFKITKVKVLNYFTFSQINNRWRLSWVERFEIRRMESFSNTLLIIWKGNSSFASWLRLQRCRFTLQR